MNRVNHNLIEQMTADLKPVKAIKPRDGWLAVALAIVLTVLAVHVIEGLRAGIVTGRASAFFMIANALLLLLGGAATASVVAMASPRVGNRYDGAKWALAMAAVVPFAALASIVGSGDPVAATADPYGLDCAMKSLIASSITAVTLIAWLRRGAPVSLAAAGWQTGIAAGALGSLAYGMSCPLDDVVHLGLYHVLPVGIAGVIGRLVVPKLVRW